MPKYTVEVAAMVFTSCLIEIEADDESQACLLAIETSKTNDEWETNPEPYPAYVSFLAEGVEDDGLGIEMCRVPEEHAFDPEEMFS
jgi:hypothetical protein